MLRLKRTELLLWWFCHLTSSGIILGRVNVVVEEGSDVILPCSPSSKENLVGELFDWKKDGRQEVFLYDAGIHYNNDRQGQDPQFKGRVSHFTGELKYGNASIMIRDTKVADSGDYTCDFPRLQPSEMFHIKLDVGASPEPVIRILSVTEDGVLLQCHVPGASPQPEVQWQDSAGNILPAEEPQVSERGGRYNVTLLATVTKADNFSCVVTQKEIGHRIKAEVYLYVHGASPEPVIRILNVTEDGAVLQCHVPGASPQPEVQWQDSAGNILPAEEPQVSERGGRYYVTLLATVTKADNFRCVVTQKEIHHETAAETFVPFYDSSSKVHIGWLFVAMVLGAVVVAVVGALLVATKCIKIHCKKGASEGSEGPEVISLKADSRPFSISRMQRMDLCSCGECSY